MSHRVMSHRVMSHQVKSKRYFAPRIRVERHTHAWVVTLTSGYSNYNLAIPLISFKKHKMKFSIKTNYTLKIQKTNIHDEKDNIILILSALLLTVTIILFYIGAIRKCKNCN